jgi:hypothetical protein
MKLPICEFTVTDWSKVEPVEFPGDTGKATWRTAMMGDARIRRVDYSPDYLADHWCDRGHVLFVLSGELDCELADGRVFKLTPGMSYQVSDFGSPAHRSRTAKGASLFIVD